MSYTIAIKYLSLKEDMRRIHSPAKTLRSLFITSAFPLLSFVVLLFSTTTFAETVKMTASKICHDSSSAYYSRTKNFTPYTTLEACLAAGGKLPKGQTQTRVSTAGDYSRDAFTHWIDTNGDCLNTRHELLLKLSTGPVTMSDDGCRVLRGRWNDPYSGDILYDTADIDIDHVVPLAWAWEHGAQAWSAEERKRFANDERNLFAVTASLNRSKGAKGPETWLPPNRQFQCQYVTRYLRVMLMYDFERAARNDIRTIQQRVCSSPT